MAKTDLISIGQITFVVAPDPEPVKPAQPSGHLSAPPCMASRSTMPPGVMCSDGISRMNYLATRFEQKKNRGRLECWFLNSWDE